jgi:hypothetical protein
MPTPIDGMAVFVPSALEIVTDETLADHLGVVKANGHRDLIVDLEDQRLLDVAVLRISHRECQRRIIFHSIAMLQTSFRQDRSSNRRVETLLKRDSHNRGRTGFGLLEYSSETLAEIEHLSFPFMLDDAERFTVRASINERNVRN